MSSPVEPDSGEDLPGSADESGCSRWSGQATGLAEQARVVVEPVLDAKEPRMLIDQWLAKLWELSLHYWGVATDAPTHFSWRHWVVFSVICVVIGCLSMRGFGSRKNY